MKDEQFKTSLIITYTAGVVSVLWCLVWKKCAWHLKLEPRATVCQAQERPESKPQNLAVLHIVMENRCHLGSFQPSTVRGALVAPADSQVEKIKVSFRTYSLLDIDLSIRNKGLTCFTLSLIRVQIHMPPSPAVIWIIIALWCRLRLVSHLCLLGNCVLDFRLLISKRDIWTAEKKIKNYPTRVPKANRSKLTA